MATAIVEPANQYARAGRPDLDRSIVSLLTTSCSIGNMITMNVRKWMVRSTETGEKSSAPKVRPPSNWNAYAPIPATRLPTTMYAVPSLRR